MCLARIRWLDTGAGRLDSAITLFWMSFPFLSFPCWYAKPWAWRSGVIQDNPSRELKYPQIMLALPLAAHVSVCEEAAQWFSHFQQCILTWSFHLTGFVTLSHLRKQDNPGPFVPWQCLVWVPGVVRHPKNLLYSFCVLHLHVSITVGYWALWRTESSTR